MTEKSQYKSLSEWKKVKPKDYNKAFREGWLDEICKTFGWKRRIHHPKNYWTKERCLIEAKKYLSRSEWSRNSNSSYAASKVFIGDFFEECTKHMKPYITPKAFWGVKEKCIAEAKKYKSRTEWEKYNPVSYKIAKKNYWLSECKPIIINYDLIKQWVNERKITI